MKILSIISSNLHSGPGVPALQHLQLLKSAGHDVLMVCLSGKNLASKAREQKININTSLHLPRDGKFWKLWQDKSLLKKITDDFLPDIIFVHKTIETILCGMVFGNKQVPVIRFWHDGHGKLPSFSENFLHKHFHIPVVATSLTGRRLTKHLSLLPDDSPLQLRGAINPNLFTPSDKTFFFQQKFNLPKDAIVVGTVSRLKPDRELPQFLLAFADAYTSLRDKRLYSVIVGKGEMESKLKDYAKKLNIAERVFIFNPKDEFIEALSNIDICVFIKPGSDGTCRTVIEAMACGIPTITSMNGSLADFAEDLNDKGGATVASNNELSSEIIRLAKDFELRKLYKHNNRKTVIEKFTDKKLQKTLDSLVLEAVSKKMESSK